MDSRETAGIRETLMAFEAYPAQTYSSIDLNRLTLFTLDLLQRKAIPATLANVTVAVYRLFPLRFALEGFEYPDSNRVNRALNLQLGPKYRNWVVGYSGGRGRDRGFELTATGRAVLEQTNGLLEPSTRCTGGVPGDDQHDENELLLVQDSELFLRYSRGSREPAEPRLVYDMLQVLPYTPKDAVLRRVRLLKGIADASLRQDLLEFLDWVLSSHPSAFTPGKNRVIRR